MDITAHRDKLVKELKETAERAQFAAQQADQLSKRATFLSGAIAALNDIIKDEQATAEPVAPVVAEAEADEPV